MFKTADFFFNKRLVTNWLTRHKQQQISKESFQARTRTMESYLPNWMDATENEKENESGQSQIHETALTKKLTVLELRTR